MKNKVWGDIKGYEGLYKISTSGEVLSLKYRGGKIPKVLKLKTYNPYPEVELSKDGKSKTYKVHRLVAQTFIPNPNNYPEVNHKDESKTNSNVDNLEWCSRSYNINYGGCKEKLSKATSRRIVGINITNGDVVKFYGMRDAEKNGFNHSGISECCNGKRKTHKGYFWRYEDD